MSTKPFEVDQTPVAEFSVDGDGALVVRGIRVIAPEPFCTREDIARLVAAVNGSPLPGPVPDTKAGRAPVQPAKRPATQRANGAPVPVSTPIPAPVAPKATQRPILPIRQPTIFLGSRSKLAPMPKRKPFSMPHDPAK